MGIIAETAVVEAAVGLWSLARSPRCRLEPERRACSSPPLLAEDRTAVTPRSGQAESLHVIDVGAGRD